MKGLIFSPTDAGSGSVYGVSFYRNVSSTNRCDMPPKKQKNAKKGSASVEDTRKLGGNNLGPVFTNPNSTVNMHSSIGETGSQS